MWRTASHNPKWNGTRNARKGDPPRDGPARRPGLLLGSRNGLSTDVDSMEDIAKKIAELVDL